MNLETDICSLNPGPFGSQTMATTHSISGPLLTKEEREIYFYSEF